MNVEEAMAAVCAMSPTGARVAVEHGVTAEMFTDSGCAAVFRASRHPTAGSAWYDSEFGQMERRLATVASLAGVPLETVESFMAMTPSACDLSGSVARQLIGAHEARAAEAQAGAEEVAAVEAWRSAPADA